MTFAFPGRPDAGPSSPSPRHYGTSTATLLGQSSRSSSSTDSSPTISATSTFPSFSLDAHGSPAPVDGIGKSSYAAAARTIRKSRTTTKTERTWRYSVPVVEGEDLDRRLFINRDGDRKSTVSFSNTAEVRVGLGLGDLASTFESRSSSSSHYRRSRPASTSAIGNVEKKLRRAGSGHSILGSSSSFGKMTSSKRQPNDSGATSTSSSASSSRSGSFSRLWQPSSPPSQGISSPSSESCSSAHSSPRLQPAFKQDRSQEVTVASKVLACTAVAAFALCALVGLLAAGYGLTAWDDVRRRLWNMKRGVKGAIGAGKGWVGDAKDAVEEVVSARSKRQKGKESLRPFLGSLQDPKSWIWPSGKNGHTHTEGQRDSYEEDNTTRQTNHDFDLSSTDDECYGRSVPSHTVEPFDIDGPPTASTSGAESFEYAPPPLQNEYSTSSSSTSRQGLPPQPPLMTLLASLLFTLCVVCGRGMFVWWAQKRASKRANAQYRKSS